MRTRALQHRSIARGAATVEFALVVPVMVVLILFSMYFTELVHAKLKLQEASRYAAWEMTSYVLDDFGQGNNDQAFTIAQNEAVPEAIQRYQDLDSVEDNAPSGFVIGTPGFNVTLENHPARFVGAQAPLPGGAGAFANQVISAVTGPVTGVLSAWGFNPKGQIQAEATVNVSNKLIPKHYLELGQGGFNRVDPTGGHDLSNLALKSRFTLVASGWTLEDGGDADMRNDTAGVIEGSSYLSGLHQQVSRMTFLGLAHAFDNLPILGSALQLLQKIGAVPAFMGTFVVAHNYEGAQPDRNWFNSGSTVNPSPDGLNNLKDDAALDYDKPRCFDTAPFRDTAQYTSSLYVQMFKARGPYFMGCVNPQADDPTSVAPPNQGDTSQDKTQCEATGP